MHDLLTADFRALSAALGQDPMRVQGAGGNTSIKWDNVMWIKASGTKLADALVKDIFVAVDHPAALAQANGAGDGSCNDTVLDPAITLRPSIETTFHAALDWAVIAHTHSIATLTHAVSPEGRTVLDKKLNGLPFVRVPYAKPGLPLTREIMARVKADTQVIVLENHGLICCANTVADAAALMDEVESRLALVAISGNAQVPEAHAPNGFSWADEGWIATDKRAAALALSGTYYPDHVVFLGPALPAKDNDGNPPVILVEGVGVLIRDDATPSQRAMLSCLSDLLSCLPSEWTVDPIGAEAEAELLDWDAEKYRQALAARS